MWKLRPEDLVRRRNEYNLFSALARTINRNRDEVSAKTLCFIKKADALWWSRLRPLPWAEELLKIDEDIVVCTGGYAFKCEGAVTGKLDWFRRFVGRVPKVIFTNSKPSLARKGVVLVDDKRSTIRKFEDAGGTGVWFPTWYNDLSGLTRSPSLVLEHVVAGCRKGKTSGQKRKVESL